MKFETTYTISEEARKEMEEAFKPKPEDICDNCDHLYQLHSHDTYRIGQYCLKTIVSTVQWSKNDHETKRERCGCWNFTSRRLKELLETVQAALERAVTGEYDQWLAEYRSASVESQQVDLPVPASDSVEDKLAALAIGAKLKDVPHNPSFLTMDGMNEHKGCVKIATRVQEWPETLSEDSASPSAEARSETNSTGVVSDSPTGYVCPCWSVHGDDKLEEYACVCRPAFRKCEPCKAYRTAQKAARGTADEVIILTCPNCHAYENADGSCSKSCR